MITNKDIKLKINPLRCFYCNSKFIQNERLICISEKNEGWQTTTFLDDKITKKTIFYHIQCYHKVASATYMFQD